RALAPLSSERFAIALAGLRGDRDAFFKAVGQAARHGDVRPALALADALGRRDAIELASDPERLGARVGDWRAGDAFALPEATADALLHAIARLRAH
ncbi:MAG: hypothetical protein KC620_25460, partial [Myxococcales bacterium]|nr:hypothetical protein [Myxococcales bacterium]